MFLPLSAFAGDLKVTDAAGMIRLVAPISGTGQLTVTLAPSANEPMQAELVPTYGLRPNIQGQKTATGFVFNGVGEGAWEISFDRTAIVVASVSFVLMTDETAR